MAVQASSRLAGKVTLVGAKSCMKVGATAEREGGKEGRREGGKEGRREGGKGGRREGGTVRQQLHHPYKVVRPASSNSHF